MQPAFGLYTHIRSNRIRSIALIVILLAQIWVLTYAVCLILEAMRQDAALDVLLHRAWLRAWPVLPVVSAVAGAWVCIAYLFQRSIIGVMTGAKAVDRRIEPKLYNLLENLCISRGMPMPALQIIETPELNAFASGITEDQYAVTVTRGLLEILSDDELEAVLAHELTHIRNKDVSLMVIAVVIVGLVTILGEMAWRGLFRVMIFGGGRRSSSSKSGNSGALPAIVIGIVMIALSWFVSQFVYFALSRRREYLADAGAVELTKNPDAMISALRRIEGHSNIEGLPDGLMEMCIDNPRAGFAQIFATHPTMDQRVAALETYADGRDLGVVPSRRKHRSIEDEPRATQQPAPVAGPWAVATGAATGGATAGPWGPQEMAGILVATTAADLAMPRQQRRPMQAIPRHEAPVDQLAGPWAGDLPAPETKPLPVAPRRPSTLRSTATSLGGRTEFGRRKPKLAT